MKRYILLVLLLIPLSAISQSLDQTHINYVNPLTYGVECNSATLTATLTNIGVAQRTMFLTATNRTKAPCVWNISQSVTVPDNVRFRVPFGVTATISAGVVVTVEGCLEADDPNWYSGAGQVVQTGSCPAIGEGSVLGSSWFSYVADGCLHPPGPGAGGVIPSCEAFILDSSTSSLVKVVSVTATTVQYTSGDGRYWVLARLSPSTPTPGWTCTGSSMYCTIKSSTPPSPPQNTLLLLQTDVTGGAMTNVGDASRRVFNRMIRFTSAMTTAETAVWIFMPGGMLDYTGLTIRHIGAVQSTTYGIFQSGGTGKITLGPKTTVDPAWFAHGGTGTDVNPWTSIDGCGGLCEAFASMQFFMNMTASHGFYRFTSSTPAMIDVPVTTADGVMTFEFSGAVIQVVTTGTIIKFNKNGVLSDVSTNLNSLRWIGGVFTTQLPGVMDPDAPIQGTALDFTRVRRASLFGTRFLGLNVGVIANVADTFEIRFNQFRRVKTCIYFPDVDMVGVPQDIFIEHNTGSISNKPPSTALNESYFIRADNRVNNMTVAHNAVANNTENSRFIRLSTGDATGATTEITIDNNATEQFGTGSKHIEIVRFGLENLSGLSIIRNLWSGPFGPDVPPYANGQPSLDLNFIQGRVEISWNTWTNQYVTAIKLTGGRSSIQGVALVGRIEGNIMPQTNANGGTVMHISDLAGVGGMLRVGENGTLPFHVDMGAIVYPDINIAFDTTPAPSANIASAPTVTVSPWDSYTEINGTNIITNVNPTWSGHKVCFAFETTDGGMDKSATLVLNSTFRARLPGESIICLQYEGIANVWKEISRSMEQQLFPATAATTLTIPGSARTISIQGDGAVTPIANITINRNSQTVTFICPNAGPFPVFNTSGNIRMPSNFTCTPNATLTLIPNNANWFQEARTP